MTRRRLLLLCLPVLLLGLWGLWALSRARSFQLAGRLVARVQTAQPLVALTFDDGPYPEHLEEVLATLEREGVRATFFVNGAALARHPGLGARLVQAGHALGNHSYSHQRLVFRSPAFVREEVERTDALIREAGFTGPIPFRPPYGKRLLVLPLYLARTGRTTVMWDVEPETDEAVAQEAGRIAAHVLERVQPGSIVVMHVLARSRGTSREALGPLIRGLKARGLRLVTVQELLAMQ